MDYDMRSAVITVRSVLETSPFNAIEAAWAVQRLAVLAPPHIRPIVDEATKAIAKSIENTSNGYDNLARYSLKQLLTAMERSFLRVVK